MSNSCYLVPAHETRQEIKVENSRFIASLAPTSSVEEARDFIARVRTEFSDASHNIPAYIIGAGNTFTEFCSDDGEPSGTAGRPALAVLKGSKLGDICVVITRYFGGTKLGTGGLVKAYTQSVKSVLEITPRAKKFLASTLELRLPYSLLERLRLLVPAWDGRIISEKFTEAVEMRIQFPAEKVEDFQICLSELTSGSLQAALISTGYAQLQIEQ